MDDWTLKSAAGVVALLCAMSSAFLFAIWKSLAGGASDFAAWMLMRFLFGSVAFTILAVGFWWVS
jgi:hypothetical protein